jgi:hypothetical protein
MHQWDFGKSARERATMLHAAKPNVFWTWLYLLAYGKPLTKNQQMGCARHELYASHAKASREGKRHASYFRELAMMF